MGADKDADGLGCMMRDTYNSGIANQNVDYDRLLDSPTICDALRFKGAGRRGVIAVEAKAKLKSLDYAGILMAYGKGVERLVDVVDSNANFASPPPLVFVSESREPGQGWAKPPGETSGLEKVGRLTRQPVLVPRGSVMGRGNSGSRPASPCSGVKEGVLRAEGSLRPLRRRSPSSRTCPPCPQLIRNATACLACNGFS